MPHVVAATLVVAVGPIAAIWALRREGVVHSPALAIVLGTALAFGASYLGATLWKSRRGSGDLLFSELMLWGWLRRLWLERRIRNTVALLDGVDDDAALTRDRRAQLLLDLANALEAGDAYTSGHSRRVARHSEMIARRLGLPTHEISKVRTAAALHDVGKLDTPRQILHKRGRLDDAEFAVIKQHPGRGGELVARLGDPELSTIIRHHHERIDGTGYPDGLAGDAIPLAARVIAVADTFDAIISTRPYRPGASHRRAIDVLTDEAGTQLDPAAVRAFTSVYSGRRPLSLWMILTSAPERLSSWLGGGINTAAAASITRVMTATAVTTAAAAGVMTASSLNMAAPGLTGTQARLVAMAASAERATARLTVTPPTTSAQLTSTGSAAGATSAQLPSLIGSGPVSLLTATRVAGTHAAGAAGKILTVPVTPGSGAQVTISTPASPSASTTTPNATAPTTPTAPVSQGPSTTPSSGGGSSHASGGNGHANGHPTQSSGTGAGGSSGAGGSASNGHGNGNGNGNGGNGNGNGGNGNGNGGNGNSSHATGGNSGSTQGSGHSGSGQGSGSQSSGSAGATPGGTGTANGNGNGNGNAGSNGNGNAGSNGNGNAGSSGNGNAGGNGNPGGNTQAKGHGK